ncbi:MAG: type II secretion system F family protein, partial [Bacilli bacterium]|nr:type II secretion system F family protein [Bacilli bacterium]
MYITLCIYVYRSVSCLTRIPILFARFFSLGFFFTLWYFISNILTVIKEFLLKFYNGIVFFSMIVSKIVRSLLKYPFVGIIAPFIYVGSSIRSSARVNKHVTTLQNNAQEQYNKMSVQLQELINKRKAQEIVDARRAKERALREKVEEREALLRKKAEEVELKKKRAIELKEQKEQAKIAKAEWQDKNTYVNEAVEIKDVTRKEKIKRFNETIKNLPTNIKKYLNKKYNNLTFVKNARNKEDINRQALLISFEGDDAVKSDKKRVFEYVGRNSDGKLVKDYFEAFSKVEVHSFLLSEGFEVYSIKSSKWIQAMFGTPKTNKTKIKTKDLIFFITQLSTYIKAGIPLVESLKILSRQYKNKKYQRIFRAVIYDLTMGENFSNALEKQGEAFPRLLINMIKASEMTGELPEALDDMSEYFTEAEKTRKQMVTAMMYPSIILVIALAAITFIMVFVIPKFVQIYEGMDGAEIPAFTLAILNLSNFLQKNFIWIFVGFIVFLLLFRYLYKSIKIFKTMVQWSLMHLPVIGTVIIYNEITMFTKTFASLLAHNVFITDSMEILNKLTNNEIYKMIMLDTITNLARGEKISLAFKDHWAVPLPAYEMIVTGERTGQLPE